jgi:hypothetical protein
LSILLTMPTIPNSSLEPTLAQSFDSFIGSRTPTRDWRFGSAQTAGTPITNVTDLAAHFNAYEDFTSTTVINSELQRYQPFSASSNFVFGSDYLALTGTASTTVAPTAMGTVDSTGITPGGSCALARTTIGSTTNIEVGQVCLLQYRSGFYWVTAKDASSFTLSTALGYGADTSLFQNNGIVFPRWYAIATASAVNGGDTTLNFASGAIPSGVTVGMEACIGDANGPGGYGNCRVTAKTATTVTLDRGFHGFVAQGGLVWFIPAIESAQIWSQDAWAAGLYGTSAVALELECKMPGKGDNVLGWSDASAQDTDEAFGAWPAFWLYSSTAPSGVQRDSSEIDIIEMWNHSTLDMRIFTGFQHGGALETRIFNDSSTYGASWWDTYNYLNTGVQFPLAYHKIQLVWTKDRLFRYIDGVLVSCYLYQWTSLAKAQIGINLAVGSAAYYYSNLFLLPLHDDNFDYMDLRIKHLKVWAL